jgi:peptide/nickel transport system permease protein
MTTQGQTSSIIQIGAQTPSARSKSLFERALFRIRRDRLTLIALTVMTLMTLMAIGAPLISTYILQVDYLKQDPMNKYAPVNSPGHILGTDELGRDHLARLLYGGQVSLGIAFSAAVLSLSIGVVIGVITGYYGGIVDDVVIWVITTLNSIPSIFLLLIVSALLSPGPLSLVLVLSFLGWTGGTRLIRGETFALRERDYILAARALGASDVRIMFQHIMPNAISLVIVSLAQGIGGLILAESGLSFLGFGIKPPTPSWGNMLSAGLDLLRFAPHLVIAPGLLIAITVLCLYIIGDGLRDAFDPRIED